MKKIKFFLRLLISAVLIYLLFQKISISDLYEMISRIGWFYFFICVFIYLVSQIVSSIRWQMILKTMKEDVSVFVLVVVYLIGMFANLFLPSIIGGDVLKVYLLRKRFSLQRVADSIIMERYNGLFALCAISVVGAAYNKDWRIILILLSVFFLVAFFPFFLKKFTTLSSSLGKKKAVNSFLQDMGAFSHDKKALFLVTLLSFVVQFIVIGIIIVIGRRIGIEASIFYYFIFVPLIILLSFLPISLNGIGIREWAFVFFFSTVGASKVEAISLSLSFFFVTVAASLFGGLSYFLWKEDGYSKEGKQDDNIP